MPNFGGGRPPRLGEQRQARLLDLLCEGQLRKKQEIQHLINKDFDVKFYTGHLTTFLEKLNLSCTMPRNKCPSQPKDAEEILDEHVADAFDEESDEPHNKRDGDDDEGWIVDEEAQTDSRTMLDFSTHRIHSRWITHSDSTSPTTLTSPDRW